MATTTHTTAAQLQQTLAEHGIMVDIVTHPGASVDLHEVVLAPGTKLAKIKALADDLALAVGVESVRILAPIPGTTNVGIETPALERTVVDYQSTDGVPIADVGLPFPVGQQVGNGVIWADLSATPHLLIAGATGSGKSVALNTVLTSLIDHVDADTLRLHLVDPKRVELGAFAAAPQVESFVTNVEDAVDLLDALVDEMDRRYEAFEEEGVRNITEWNSLATLRLAVLPYHVLVVDELADLMSGKARADVESAIQRLTQLARAAGIHLILATQRPSVDVITGVIKGNVPSRWAFTVAAGVDSKVILDSTGAENLYGKGDSLWSPYGATKPLRVQGVWTSDDEVARAVSGAQGRGVLHQKYTLNQRAAREGDPVDLGIREFEADHVDIPRENLRDLAITDDTTGLGTSYPTADQLAIPPGDEGHIPAPFNVDLDLRNKRRPLGARAELDADRQAVFNELDRLSFHRIDQAPAATSNAKAWAILATFWVAIFAIVALVVTR